ncbi:hypothetical protein V7O66_10325 [Methanolobus sp. ZRKC3]|uniref:hypothetical protein n=1 Tax=Methanolobus sp. ZRKC3 TaxID=3125786 RepID=UPI00325547F6
MEKSLRIEKLNEIKKQTPYMTGIRIRYKGEIKEFDAYKIPLEYLIYNKYNGRIGSSVKSYEKQYHEIDPEDSDHKKIIEKFLWDSKKDRNKMTEQNLVENGQKRHGIVTADGIIIDGNRRSMLLNRIYAERENWQKKGTNVDNCKFFISVILPEDADPKEIQRLETTYQMGEDEKLDYNPVEKYLKIKDLLGYGFSSSDIASMMLENERQIKEWIEIMNLMDQYLEYLHYDGIYTRLDKTEGPLVDLNNYIKRYQNGSQFVGWDYDEMDLNEMMLLSFDYIRARYEGKDFRTIAKPSRKESIFCKSEELWNSFLKDHKETIRELPEEAVEELRAEHSTEDISKLLRSRDEDWKKEVAPILKGNLDKAENRLKDLNDANQPLELAKKALNALESVNTEIEEFFKSKEVLDVLQQINKCSLEYMNTINNHKH